MKVCSKCKETKPFSAFSLNSSSKDGYQNQCKSCQKDNEKQLGIKSKSEVVDFIKHEISKGTKYTCSSCGKVALADAFYPMRRHGKIILATYKCKECQKDYQRLKKFPNKDYDTMLSAQNGRCAICGTSEADYMREYHKKFAIDHDHSNGRVRGLLCDKCNRGLGFFKDSQDNLNRAITYLKR